MSLDTSRTEYILGKDGCRRLAESRVLVFGVGGVGGHLCEALARAGVGTITVVDGDDVAPSNLNRQIIALSSTVGRPKVEVIKERIALINPDCKVEAKKLFYLPENADEIDFGAYDAVADAVDTVAAKVDIICRAKAAGAFVISSMGAGNKLYPERFRVSDIYSTSVCPLARVMRRELKARGVKSLSVVWSDEAPIAPKVAVEGRAPGSISFVPAAAGLVMAGEIVRRLAL